MRPRQVIVDLEAGVTERQKDEQSPRPALSVRRRPKLPSTSQEVGELMAKLKRGTFLTQSRLKLSCESFVEYLQEEFLCRAERFVEVMPYGNGSVESKKLWLFKAVAELHDQMRNEPDFSIAGAVIQLQRNSLLRSPAEDEQDRSGLCTELVFTLVGIMSMLYPPAPAKAMGELRIDRISSKGGGSLRQYVRGAVNASEADRPLRDMLVGFGELRPHYGDDAEDAAPIGAAQLNADILVSVGRVRIEWTDLLPMHLSLDVSTKTLYLFQRPTFCLLNIAADTDAEKNRPGGILESCLGCEASTGAAPRESIESEYMKEVLLSIHMLFGQSRRPVKLFNSRAVSGTLAVSAPDPLLPILCTEPWPFTDWSHQPKKRYLLDEDFPLLSRKIQIVNEYFQGKQPTSIWALWRDDRNPLQWWTFWAVIVIGGCGVFLGVAQTVLAIAQLYYAVESSTGHYSDS